MMTTEELNKWLVIEILETLHDSVYSKGTEHIFHSGQVAGLIRVWKKLNLEGVSNG